MRMVNTPLSLNTNQHELMRIDQDATSAQLGLIRICHYEWSTNALRMPFERAERCTNSIRIAKNF